MSPHQRALTSGGFPWDGLDAGMGPGRTETGRSPGGHLHRGMKLSLGEGFPWEELCLNQRRCKEKVEMSSGTRIGEYLRAKTHSSEGLGCHTGNGETRIGHEHVCPQAWSQDRERGSQGRRLRGERSSSASPALLVWYPLTPRGLFGVFVLETLSAPQSPTRGRARGMDPGVRDHAFSSCLHSRPLLCLPDPHTFCLGTSGNQPVPRCSFFLPKKVTSFPQRNFRTETVSFRPRLTQPLPSSY